MLTHLSLFSGIGGLDLAAEWAGIQTVGQCEWADYPTKVLERHWPDLPRWRDIRTLTGGDFYEKTNRRTVDIISGGFPCQPFSVAGKQRGKEDDRFLWPEMVRIIKELRPTWVIGENVAGIIRLALDEVLFDLEGEGYATRTFLIPACGVGALHQRYRTAIVAHSNSIRYWFPETGDSNNNEKWNYKAQKQAGRTKSYETVTGSQIASNTNSTSKGLPEQESQRPDWWSAEPTVGRVANGISDRVDRIRCLGNAVVPQQFYPIFQAIADIESGV